MPEKKTIERARADRRAGKSPSTQAGEFVREEIEHVREGKHGARSTKQAIAIGLSKARRAGVKLPAPKKGSKRVRRQAQRDLARAKSSREPSRARSRSARAALGHDRKPASRSALARQARRAASRRTAAGRSRAAEKAVRTKGQRGLRQAARKAARTRKRNQRT